MPNIKGSITGQKKRYTNDFALDSSLNTNNTITLSTGFPFAQVGEDWSLSGWYCHKIDNGNPYVITNRQNGGAFNGWAVRLTNFTTYKTFTFLTDTSTGQTNYVFSSTDQLPKSARFGWIHFVFNYNSTTREMSLFADSKFVSSQVIAADEFQNPASECLFFAFWGGAVQTKAINKDYALFNRELTQREITYIYEVGVLPSSTHEACQFHMPMNQIALIDGTDRLMLDVIENYNYAKTVNLTPNHGVMSGWSDIDLGLGTNGLQEAKAYKGFYSKDNYYFSGLDFKTTNTGTRFLETPSITTSLAIPTNFTFKFISKQPFSFGTSDRNSIFGSYLNPTSNPNSIPYFEVSKRRNGNIWVITGNGSSEQFTEFVDPNNNTKTHTYVIVKIGSNYRFYVDGRFIEQLPIPSIGVTSNFGNANFIGILPFSPAFAPNQMIMYEVTMLNKDLTDSEAKTYSLPINSFGANFSSFVSPSDMIFSYKFNGNNEQTIYKDLGSNNFDADINGFSPSETGEIGALEVNSNLPSRIKGLQFDSVSGHNLTIQGLNTAKANGYTFLVAVANKTNAAWTSGQANIFSHVGTQGSSRQFEIEGSASNTGKALRIIFPSGSSTAGLDSYADNDFDNSKIQFASFALSPNQDYYLTYLRSSQTRGYGQASFNTNVNQSNSINTSFPLSFGFNEITNAVTKIGYDGTDSFDGILCYFAIVEGLEDQATIKRQFNNGLLSNPSDFERLGLNLAFFADLNNPFDDAGTIKIPDLGDNNLTVIASSDLDSTWNTLSGTEGSQVELKTLI